MFGFFKNAVADPREQAAAPHNTQWATTPRTEIPDPPCPCEDCQRGRAAHFYALGYDPRILPDPRLLPRNADCRHDIDPTIYKG